jgi:hypothetical protein
MSESPGNYEMLVQCWLSGQMSERQLFAHFADEVFRRFFERKMAQRRRV